MVPLRVLPGGQTAATTSMTPASDASSSSTTPSRELDRVTLTRAQQGDGESLRQLVHLYEGRVFHLCARLLPSTTAAEDATQETFARALPALPGFAFDGPARLSTWLLTIATRVCLDELRRARRRQTGEARLEDVEAQARALAPHLEDVEARITASALRRRLEDGLEQLPEPMRLVFVWRVLLERSVEETATGLGVDVGTVKSRLSRARTALRPLLAEGGAP